MCCVQNISNENPNVIIEKDQNGSPLYDQTINNYKEKILTIRLVTQLKTRNQNADINFENIIKYNIFVNALKNNPNDSFVKIFCNKIISLVEIDYQHYKKNYLYHHIFLLPQQLSILEAIPNIFLTHRHLFF